MCSLAATSRASCCQRSAFRSWQSLTHIAPAFGRVQQPRRIGTMPQYMVLHRHVEKLSACFVVLTCDRTGKLQILRCSSDKFVSQLSRVTKQLPVVSQNSLQLHRTPEHEGNLLVQQVSDVHVARPNMAQSLAQVADFNRLPTHFRKCDIRRPRFGEQ